MEIQYAEMIIFFIIFISTVLGSIVYINKLENNE